jgi:hypothetical protein
MAAQFGACRSRALRSPRTLGSPACCARSPLAPPGGSAPRRRWCSLGQDPAGVFQVGASRGAGARRLWAPGCPTYQGATRPGGPPWRGRHQSSESRRSRRPCPTGPRARPRVMSARGENVRAACGTGYPGWAPVVKRPGNRVLLRRSRSEVDGVSIVKRHEDAPVLDLQAEGRDMTLPEGPGPTWEPGPPSSRWRRARRGAVQDDGPDITAPDRPWLPQKGFLIDAHSIPRRLGLGALGLAPELAGASARLPCRASSRRRP